MDAKKPTYVWVVVYVLTATCVRKKKCVNLGGRSKMDRMIRAHTYGYESANGYVVCQKSRIIHSKKLNTEEIDQWIWDEFWNA